MQRGQRIEATEMSSSPVHCSMRAVASCEIASGAWANSDNHDERGQRDTHDKQKVILAAACSFGFILLMNS